MLLNWWSAKNNLRVNVKCYNLTLLSALGIIVVSVALRCNKQNHFV